MCDVCEGGSNYFVSCHPLFVAFYILLGCINVTQRSVWGHMQYGRIFEIEWFDTLVSTCTLVTSLHRPICFSCRVCYDPIYHFCIIGWFPADKNQYWKTR